MNQPKPIPVTTKLYDIHPPRFLSGAELTKPVVVTIEHAQYEDVRNEEGEIESRAVLYARGAKRGIVFNKTLGKCFAKIAQVEPHELTFARIIGAKVELYQCRTRNKKNWMICARAVAAPLTRPAESNNARHEAEELTQP